MSLIDDGKITGGSGRYLSGVSRLHSASKADRNRATVIRWMEAVELDLNQVSLF